MIKSLRKLFRGKKSAAPVTPFAEMKARYPDFSDEEIETILAVESCTMTSPERIQALLSGVDHIERHGLAGALVECGVWRGGSSMAMARSLLQKADKKGRSAPQRQLFLYDTYEGMPPAGAEDRDFMDADADDLLSQQDRNDPQSVWCYSGLEEVKRNMESTGYPIELLHFVKGRVEDTLPEQKPDSIALLRLDTDWYESTRCCLEHLYPLLEPGGILIIDDYGHWQGCRQAVDEYFAENHLPVFLQRIDYTGRIAIKPPELEAAGRSRRIA